MNRNAKLSKKELEQQLIMGAREHGIGSVLFRHAVGDRLGVNVTDMECLAIIFFKGAVTPTELGRNVGLTSGATTAMLDRLEKSGLVERRPNPKDRRSSLIVVIDEAINKIAPLFASLRAAQEALIANYSREELELLTDFFRLHLIIWEEERQKLQPPKPERRGGKETVM